MNDKIENQSQFFISYLLDFYLREGNGVILVSSSQNYASYLSISKRLGLNIESNLNNENLTFIDCFTGSSDWFTEEIPFTEETGNLWSAMPMKAKQLNFKEGSEDTNIKEILEMVQNIIPTMKGNIFAAYKI